MNTFRKLLSGFLALSMLAACSDDITGNGDEDNTNRYHDGEGVFMAIDFQLPGGVNSRSNTVTGGNSSDGTEVGKDFENNVTDALIVLCAAERQAFSNGAGNDSTIINKYGYISSSLVQSNRIANESDNLTKQYRATARLEKTNLDEFYAFYPEDYFDVAKEGPKVLVFVFCNPTTDLVQTLSDADVNSVDWINATCEVIQGRAGYNDVNVGIWGENSFLMNNARLAIRALPPTITMWERFNTVENPYHLSQENVINDELTIYNNSAESNANSRGAVKVERSVARFDFRDGSKGADGKPNNNTYPALYYTDLQGNIQEDMPIIDVQMQKMCLVNMSNSFYYVPRVSTNGQGWTPGQATPAGFSICGAELPWSRDTQGNYSGGNYVVGPYANVFRNTVTTGFRTYFNYPFFEDNGSFNNAIAGADRWNVVKIDDVLKGQDDNYDQGDYNPGDYKIWRYVTENVIPGTRDNQKNGISTGIVFKARILGDKAAADGDYNVDEEAWNAGVTQNLANCLNNGKFIYEKTEHQAGSLTGSSKTDPILYYINGTMYMGFPHLRQAAIQSAVTINSVGVMEINRSGSLYKAVFGDGPIPGNNVYIVVNAENKIEKQVKVEDPEWSDDFNPADGAKYDYDKHTDAQNAAYSAYCQSTNYAFIQWYNAGRPVDEIGTTETPATLSSFRKAATGAGISIFQSSHDEDFGNGYYCYYYYWNRHNDNGRNGVMGPMEFDVVRNNVYKISIDKVSRIGHPRNPDNDPNNPNPGDPDESDQIYLDVNVQIVPWAVRINNVHF